MRCSEALVVHLQGEDADVSKRRVAQAHVASCPSCAGVVDDLQHGETDLATVLQTLVISQTTPRPWIRVTLLGLAIVQLIFAIPWIFGVNILGSETNVEVSHLTRDGVISLFVATAGLVVAVKYRYALPALAVASVGITVQVIAGAIDENQNSVDTSFEFLHLLALAILVIIAIIAGSRASLSGSPKRGSGLRIVR